MDASLMFRKVYLERGDNGAGFINLLFFFNNWEAIYIVKHI